MAAKVDITVCFGQRLGDLGVSLSAAIITMSDEFLDTLILGSMLKESHMDNPLCSVSLPWSAWVSHL